MSSPAASNEATGFEGSEDPPNNTLLRTRTSALRALLATRQRLRINRPSPSPLSALRPEVHVLARQPAEISQRLARDQQRSRTGPPADQVRFAGEWIALLAKAHDRMSREPERVRRFLERQPILWIIDIFHVTYGAPKGRTLAVFTVVMNRYIVHKLFTSCWNRKKAARCC